MDKGNLPKISFVIPVRNGEKRLSDCLNSLIRLNYPGDKIEIIVADGMSSDRTAEIAVSKGAKVVVNEGRLIVTARNVGFEASSGELIVFTDDDCIFPEDWLLKAVRYFLNPELGGVAGPVEDPRSSKGLSRAVGFIYKMASLSGASVHYRALDKPVFVNNLPGCSCIFRREVLQKVLPISHRLTNEDVLMGYLIYKSGYRQLIAPELKIYHFHKEDILSFAKQIYRYALGRIQIWRIHRELMHPLHFIVAMIPVILVIFFIVNAGSALGIFMFFLICCLIAGTKERLGITGTAILPWAILVFVLSWSAGFWRSLIIKPAL